MNNTPSFYRSPIGSTRSKLNTPLWDKVLETYDNKDYKEVLPTLLDYIDGELIEKYGNAEKNYFEIPHGSIIVKIKQTDEELIIEAPFLDISESSRIPLMRQVAQLNFHPLTLVKIVLDDNDQLKFTIKMPLELSDPYKLYDVLREICNIADKYDDEFITKFKAKWLQEPRIVRLSKEVLDDAWDKMQMYVDEAFEYIKFMEQKGIKDYVYDVLKSTFLKMDYYMAPQGFVRSEFEQNIAAIDSHASINDRLFKGKEFLARLEDYDKAKFLEDIYYADVFIPYKFRSNLDDVRKNFQYAYETSREEISKRSFMGAYYTIYCELLRLFYYNNVEDDLADLVTDALENSSEKPWEEGATILREALDIIMSETRFNEYQQKYFEE